MSRFLVPLLSVLSLPISSCSCILVDHKKHKKRYLIGGGSKFYVPLRQEYFSLVSEIVNDNSC